MANACLALLSSPDAKPLHYKRPRFNFITVEGFANIHNLNIGLDVTAMDRAVGNMATQKTTK